jgi:hypothetical protein
MIYRLLHEIDSRLLAVVELVTSAYFVLYLADC